VPDWFAGLPVCRFAGLPVCRFAGLPDCRTAGLLNAPVLVVLAIYIVQACPGGATMIVILPVLN
jgi:hypothetical protein